MKKLSNINNRTFEGYIWLSDQEKPILLRNETFDFSKYEEGANPFIVEALLYNNNNSVHIQHTGRYVVKEFDFKHLENKGAVFEDVKFLPHRLDSVNKVKFKQLWLPEEDADCENMPVLKMKALIFTGFDKQ